MSVRYGTAANTSRERTVTTRTEWELKGEGWSTRGLVDRAVGAGVQGRGLLVLAHGAGGSACDVGMEALRLRLNAAGVDTVRFDFPYRARGSGRPDPMPVLTACVAAVADRARVEGEWRRVFLGGRSMGGRAASMLAAAAFPCDGLMLFAYPLHPAGQPAKLRDGHLAAIRAPVLCVSGTRDALCDRALMQPVVTPLAPRWTMHWLEGADHGFHVLKRSGRTDADVLDEVEGVVRRWLPA
jgi:predicted alpha/beta-hydrolase family hydrolase